MTQKPELGTCQNAHHDPHHPHTKGFTCVGWQALPPSPMNSTFVGSAHGPDNREGLSSSENPGGTQTSRPEDKVVTPLPPSQEGTTRLTRFRCPCGRMYLMEGQVMPINPGNDLLLQSANLALNTFKKDALVDE